MNAIILHGRPGKKEYYSDEHPSSSNYHWIPWLQKQLMIRDIKADTPEIPNAYAPDWQTWCTEFERFEVNEGTILVGHSNGGGFLVRWLSENPDIKVKFLGLVAPSFNEGELTDGDFFDFKIDSSIASRVGRIVVFNGMKDSQSVHDSIESIVKEIDGVELREFENLAHFCVDDMESEKFPELLEEILK